MPKQKNNFDLKKTHKVNPAGRPANFLLFREMQSRQKKSLVFSRYGIMQNWEDARWNPSRQTASHWRRLEYVGRTRRTMDGVYRPQILASSDQKYWTAALDYERIREKYSSFSNYARDLARGTVEGITITKMWNISIASAIIFGMLTMTMIYRYLGGSASASGKTETAPVAPVAIERSVDDFQEDSEFLSQLVKGYLEMEKTEQQSKLEEKIREMVKGYPIEKMIPFIVRQDRLVAALLVGIAMQESTWGVHVPVLNGQDCYNYWGYRGIRDKMGTGGHTCFDSPEDAVETVAKRIKFLVSNEKLSTPAKMVVWKCGYDCSWDSRTQMNNWISTVDHYFQKLNDSDSLTFSKK